MLLFLFRNQNLNNMIPVILSIIVTFLVLFIIPFQEIEARIMLIFIVFSTCLFLTNYIMFHSLPVKETKESLYIKKTGIRIKYSKLQILFIHPITKEVLMYKFPLRKVVFLPTVNFNNKILIILPFYKKVLPEKEIYKQLFFTFPELWLKKSNTYKFNKENGKVEVYSKQKNLQK